MPALGATLALCAVVLSTFGPYVVAGLRTDQVTIYGLALSTAVLAPSMWLRVRPSGTVVAIVSCWCLYALTGFVGTIGPAQAMALWPTGSRLAGIDNLVLPLATLFVVLTHVHVRNRDQVLRLSCLVLVVLTALNGALAILSTRLDLTNLLRHWWSSNAEGGIVSTAELSAQLGRIGGIFNQPAEAGLMYGLGGLAAVYLWHSRPSLLYPAIALIFTGGLLCVSKVFILGGAPLIVWQVWKVRRGRMGLGIPMILAAVAALQSGVFDGWNGISYLTRLFHPMQRHGGGLLDFYTAGRLGSSSTLTSVAQEVLRRSPLSGVGAGGWRVPYDNGWVEAFVMAGVVGVVCYSITLLLFWRVTTNSRGHERLLISGLSTLAILCSIGLPALTANRSGAVLWLLIGLLAIPSTQSDDGATVSSETQSGSMFTPSSVSASRLGEQRHGRPRDSWRAPFVPSRSGIE